MDSIICWLISMTLTYGELYSIDKEDVEWDIS